MLFNQQEQTCQSLIEQHDNYLHTSSYRNCGSLPQTLYYKVYSTKEFVMQTKTRMDKKMRSCPKNGEEQSTMPTLFTINLRNVATKWQCSNNICFTILVPNRKRYTQIWNITCPKLTRMQQRCQKAHDRHYAPAGRSDPPVHSLTTPILIT